MGNESGEIITTSLFSLTGIMVSKGNDPQMAQQFRLVNYSNLPRWMEMTHDFPAMLAEAMAARWILAPTFAISSNARSIDSQEDNAGRDNGRPIVAASRSKYVQILRKYQELEELVGVLSFLWFNRSKDPGTIIPIDCGLEVISSYKSYLCSQTKNDCCSCICFIFSWSSQSPANHFLLRSCHWTCCSFHPPESAFWRCLPNWICRWGYL